ncbi:MAG TPA: type II toxin-antitoxin system RelE/ParE family toxin, partial [Terriglobales bacterium]|nr:type II toxin-antitoxin system RelE/ParE family toxin [Terriglobales bacterium]
VRFLPAAKQNLKTPRPPSNAAEGIKKVWYRLRYVRRAETIQVLHCFEKRSNAIEQKDIETAKARLKRVLEAKREDKKNAKQALRRS